MVSRRLQAVVAVFAALLLLHVASGAINRLKVEEDDRKWFLVENFGFLYGGTLNITINSFISDPPNHPGTELIVAITQTDSTIMDPCDTQTDTVIYKLLDLSTVTQWPHVVTKRIATGLDADVFHQEGLYSIFFRNCMPVTGSDEPAEVTMEMELILANAGPDYLSAGASALPNVFFAFTGVHTLLTVVWVVVLRRFKEGTRRLHWLMGLLVVFKMLSLLFEGLKYHFVQTTGTAVGWAVMYYIFTFIKTLMRVTILLLMGAGWTLLKPFLSDREKKIIIIVLPLQLISNIAIVVINEMLPGTQGWASWSSAFYLFDLLCCVAIMLPIVWSIRSLRDMPERDEKSARNLEKLTLFRRFYIITISYIYFTRIIVFLLEAVLPFRVIWLSNLFEELATLSFFVVAGYLFRPVPQNPYLRVDQDDNDDIESHDGVVVSAVDSIPMGPVSRGASARDAAAGATTGAGIGAQSAEKEAQD